MKVRSQGEKTRILSEAKGRFQRVESWEGEARPRFVEDVKFAEGDSDNNWQWPDEVRQPREGDERPMLTINKTRQHNLNILNDARQSKVGVKILARGDGATAEAAEQFMGVVRAIEYRSNADSAYQHALKFAVQGGIGYWRVLTDYVDTESFDQECLIKRIKDPLLVYMDPDINEADGSDQKFCFVATDHPRKEWEKANPAWKGKLGGSTFDMGGWITDEKVREAEYWRRVPVKDRLVAFTNPYDGTKALGRESKLPRRIRKAVMDAPDTLTREITDWKVECFKIVGNEIIEEETWLGIYIPVVRVVGEETVIDGVLDRKGHTRALKDSNRMFNYNASAFIEFGALQTKAPYLGAIEAIEDFEDIWKDANKKNYSYLPFNARDEQGNELPTPSRPGPPTASPAYLEGMNSAAEWMRMASGQYQADMGAPGNERSGKAINARQRQGDLATFHYLDHQSLAIRFTGKILLDLIPKIYDTKRVLHYMAEDGTEKQVHIDPDQKQATQTQRVQGEDTEITIFNPNVGRYEVQADVGPNYATQRQDAWQAGVEILQRSAQLTSIIGDLVIQNADFPGADEMAKRLKRMVPPQALDEDANPEVMGLKQQLQEAGKFIQVLSQKLADKGGDLKIKGEKVAVDAYRATTDRLAAVKEALATDPQGVLVLVREVLEEAQWQSAGGGAEQHMAEEVPGAEALHTNLGGSLAPPAAPVPAGGGEPS